MGDHESNGSAGGLIDLHNLGGEVRPYDVRTCAERHEAEISELRDMAMELHHAQESLTRAVKQLGEQVLDLARIVEQWQGEL